MSIPSPALPRQFAGDGREPRRNVKKRAHRYLNEPKKFERRRAAGPAAKKVGCGQRTRLPHPVEAAPRSKRDCQLLNNPLKPHDDARDETSAPSISLGSLSFSERRVLV